MSSDSAPAPERADKPAARAFELYLRCYEEGVPLFPATSACQLSSTPTPTIAASSRSGAAWARAAMTAAHRAAEVPVTRVGMASGQSYLDGTFFYSTDGAFFQGGNLFAQLG